MSTVDEVLAWLVALEREDTASLEDDELKRWLAQHIVTRDASIRRECVLMVRQRAAELEFEGNMERDDNCAAHLFVRAGVLSDVAKELEMTDKDRYEQLSGGLGLKVANEAIAKLDEAARPIETVTRHEGPVGSPPWNPPLPPGWRYMHQQEVTPGVAAWASKILYDPQTYPMHCFVQRGDGGALVQWHTYQGATGKHGLFRGVSLIVFEDEEESYGTQRCGRTMSEQDQPIPEDEKIRAAFPTRSGDHETYAQAMRMVGAKHSKQALIELVNWLLMRAKVAEDRNAELVKLVEEILEKDPVCCEFAARACCDVYPESKKWWCWTCRAEALLEINDDRH